MSAIHMTDDHVYSWSGDGEPIVNVPSVTTIAAFGEQADLDWWHGKLAAEYAIDHRAEWEACGEDRRAAVDLIGQASTRYRDHTADVGTRAHAWCEERVLHPNEWVEIDQGDPPIFVRTLPDDADIRGHAAQFEKFLADFQPTYHHVEAVVYSYTHQFAGTLDWIADIPGYGLTLGDIKTGASIRGKVALQLAALANADFIGLPDGTQLPLPTFDMHAVLHLRPRTHHLLPVTVGEDEWLAFLYAAQIRLFTLRSASLIGEALTPKVPV